MSKHFTYGEFKELWKKLSEKDKNALFYDSLFDYSSFEEDENLLKYCELDTLAEIMIVEKLGELVE